MRYNTHIFRFIIQAFIRIFAKGVVGSTLPQVPSSARGTFSTPQGGHTFLRTPTAPAPETIFFGHLGVTFTAVPVPGAIYSLLPYRVPTSQHCRFRQELFTLLPVTPDQGPNSHPLIQMQQQAADTTTDARIKSPAAWNNKTNPTERTHVRPKTSSLMLLPCCMICKSLSFMTSQLNAHIESGTISGL